jgi:hypothetical protein
MVFCAGGFTLADNLTPRLQLSGNVEQAWQRLALGSGASSDVGQVLDALSQLWSTNSSDPRAIDLWLTNHGLDKQKSPREMLLRAKAEFDRYQVIKKTETEKLVRGISSGPNVSNFFSGLRDAPFELKQIAYRQAFSVCRGERLLSVLLILSIESTALIQSLVEHLPPCGISASFCLYLKSRGAAWAQPAPPPEPHDNPWDEELELLFQLLPVPISDMEEQLARLSSGTKSRLMEHVEHLFPLLEEEGFGGFLRRQITMFVYMAAPENPIAGRIVSLITNARKGAAELELLRFAGPRLLLRMISDVSEASGGKASAASAILDALREHYPEALCEIPSNVLRRLQSSRDIALTLSVRAVTLRLELSDDEAFQRSLIRAMRSDKKGDSALWLARNPEFLEMLPLQRLSPRIFTEILSALTMVDPTRALKLLRTAASTYERIFEPRTLNAALEALKRAGHRGDELFVDLALGVLRRDAEQARSVFSRDPGLSLLFRNIWAVVGRSNDEKLWSVAFDAVSSKISEAFVLNWLQEPPSGRSELRVWIQAQYIPKLFERGVLSTRFLLALSNTKVRTEVTSVLCGVMLQRINFLRNVIAEWPKARGAYKEKLAATAVAGLRVAKRFAQNNDSFLSTLAKLQAAIYEWRVSQSPVMDDAIAATADIVLPDVQAESERALSDFFSRNLKTPHELGLFFGVNPWALSVYLSGADSAWPKFEVIADQIKKSLVFLSRLAEKATELTKNLEEDIRIDLAIAIREQLGDLEEMMAGYFVLRSMLGEIGLREAVPSLGGVVKPEEISSETHKYVRDPSEKGRLRLFGLGVKVGDRIVSSARVLKSGDENDRD